MIIGPSAGRFYLRGATDNTEIGNFEDRLNIKNDPSDQTLMNNGFSLVILFLSKIERQLQLITEEELSSGDWD